MYVHVNEITALFSFFDFVNWFVYFQFVTKCLLCLIVYIDMLFFLSLPYIEIALEGH